MQLKCSHWVYFKYYTGFPTGARVAISNLQLYKSMTCWNLRRFISLQCLLCKIFALIEKITSHFTELIDSLYAASGLCHPCTHHTFSVGTWDSGSLILSRHWWVGYSEEDNCEQQITQRCKLYVPHWNILSVYLSQYNASLYNHPQHTQAHTHPHTQISTCTHTSYRL